jgi:hypothetical protein
MITEECGILLIQVQRIQKRQDGILAFTEVVKGDTMQIVGLKKSTASNDLKNIHKLFIKQIYSIFIHLYLYHSSDNFLLLK